MTTRQACAGAIVLDDDRRLLLIKRANEPGKGLWSIPGGRCLPGESREDACVREVREETGLDVRIVRKAGDVERDGPDGVVYDITDYVCEVIGGELTAGDDAVDVRWALPDDLHSLDLVDGLVDELVRWKAL